MNKKLKSLHTSCSLHAYRRIRFLCTLIDSFINKYHFYSHKITCSTCFIKRLKVEVERTGKTFSHFLENRNGTVSVLVEKFNFPTRMHAAKQKHSRNASFMDNYAWHVVQMSCCRRCSLAARSRKINTSFYRPLDDARHGTLLKAPLQSSCLVLCALPVSNDRHA